MATNLPCPLPLRRDQRPICKIWRSFPEPHLPSGGIHVFIQIRVLEVNISPFLPFLSEFKRVGILEEKITFHHFPFFMPWIHIHIYPYVFGKYLIDVKVYLK